MPPWFGKAVASPQELVGCVVRLHDPPMPIQLDDAEYFVIKQSGQRSAQSPGIDQCLADGHVLPEVGQYILDHVDLSGRPVFPVDGVSDPPSDTRAIWPIQADGNSVLTAAARQQFVVRRRGSKLLIC